MSSSLDCLVLQAPNDPSSERSILIEPVDVLTLATYVQHCGYTVAFEDLDRFGMERLTRTRRTCRVAVVVIDYYIPLHTSRAFGLLRQVFDALQSVAEVRLLVGRPSTYEPERFLNAIPSLDGCIVGEAEDTLVRILSNPSDLDELAADLVVTRATRTALTAPRRSRRERNIYDSFPVRGPIADRELCEFDSYIDVHSIISSRGCTGACSFCSTVQYWGEWRGASPQLTVNEFAHVVRAGARKIIFLDDNFADSPARAEEIVHRIQMGGFGVPWGCLCRIENVSDKLAAAMAAAGCRWIHFGMEHGTEAVRRSIGKRFTNEESRHVIGRVRSLGMRVRTSWILDLPAASPDSVKATFDLARSLGSDEIKLHYLAVRPGSTYFRQMHQIGERPSREMFIHLSRPTGARADNETCLADAIHEFRLDMQGEGYNWVDDVGYWSRYDEVEARPDEKFLSTVVTRYGLGW